ncbi:hypothetical protein RT19_25085 [Salmonella enterica subsp. enterica]|nr:hypothetical protein [Salmonella enterica subsp. enterica]
MAFGTTTNHIFTGAMHMLVALMGASFGVGFSIIPRFELALPGFIPSPSLQYNSRITFHGILTIPSTIMPLLIGGFGNPLVPSMPCPCDTIFPRLNALSLRLLVDSLFISVLGMFLDGGVNAG